MEDNLLQEPSTSLCLLCIYKYPHPIVCVFMWGSVCTCMCVPEKFQSILARHSISISGNEKCHNVLFTWKLPDKNQGHVIVEYPFLVTIFNQTSPPKGSMAITHLPEATKHSKHAAFQILAITDPYFYQDMDASVP